MIRLRCVCGKVHTLPDDLVGQKVRCKAKNCGKVMRVSAKLANALDPALPSDSQDSLAIRGHRRCSGCDASYPADFQVCTPCGVDLDTGARIYASVESAEKSAPGIPPTAEEDAPRAPRKPAGTKANKAKGESETGIPKKIVGALKKRFGR